MRYCKGQYITIRPGGRAKPVVVVSKKISNKAVVRNKLRRQIKEIIRQNGWQSVIVRVVARPPVDSAFELLKKEIAQCLQGQRSV